MQNAAGGVSRPPHPSLCLPRPVVDEQNAHAEDAELPSPLEFRKDSEEENRDSEKDEDTKELEAVPCECRALDPAPPTWPPRDPSPVLRPFSVIAPDPGPARPRSVFPSWAISRSFGLFQRLQRCHAGVFLSQRLYIKRH